MKICIFSEDEKKAISDYQFLVKENPLYQLSSSNPLRDKDFNWDDFDLFILENHSYVSELIVLCIAHDSTDRCIFSINEKSELSTSNIQKAAFYDSFSSPINPIEVTLKVN
ncbi:MAG: hypothetical protein NXH75_14865 [Halobacteriovoraceae bacterium]|nr:hypothetical protein [Halobacteriovoraceae bacterium]